MGQHQTDQCVLNTPEAAAFCGLSPRTLEKYCISGDGPSYIKLGRSVRNQRGDLQQWMDENRLQNTAKRYAP